MNSVTVSAPGKLMLLGEHAVVHNHPCLVTAVDQRIFAKIQLTEKKEFLLNAQDVQIENYKKLFNDLGKNEIPKGAMFAETAVKNFLMKFPISSGVSITTKSEFSSQFGFGSSSAVTVCIIKALSKLLNLNLSNKQIFDIAYKTVLDVQGKGSGFDIAAAVYGGTLYFFTGGKIIEPLPVASLSLVVGYTGIKADTVTLIEQVQKKFSGKKKQLNEIYNEIAKLVEEARQALVEKNFDLFGQLLNVNQHFLAQLGVSNKKLDSMITAAKDAGAYGAKLSGAGGGDCMIAICSVDKRKKIEQKIASAGGKIIHINANAEGARLEK